MGLSLLFKIIHDLVDILIVQDSSDLPLVCDELLDSVNMCEIVFDHLVNFFLDGFLELSGKVLELLDQHWLGFHEIFSQFLSLDLSEFGFFLSSDPGSVLVRHILEDSLDLLLSLVVNEFLHLRGQVLSQLPAHSMECSLVYENIDVVLKIGLQFLLQLAYERDFLKTLGDQFEGEHKNLLDPSPRLPPNEVGLHLRLRHGIAH